MATYVVLMNWTEQGIRDPEGFAQRVATSRQQVEQVGGQVDAVYVTMGIYDVVAVVSGVDDTTMAKLAIGFGRAGNIRTTTLRAFPEQEAVQLMQSI